MSFKYHDYQCESCGHIEEHLLSTTEDKNDLRSCVHCGTISSKLLPNAVANYHIKGDNSASVRPKAGLVRKK